MVKSALEPLIGDGIITWDEVQEDPAETTIRGPPADLHDKYSAEILYPRDMWISS